MYRHMNTTLLYTYLQLSCVMTVTVRKSALALPTFCMHASCGHGSCVPGPFRILHNPAPNANLKAESHTSMV